MDWKNSYSFNNRKQFKEFAQKYNISWPQAISYNLWKKLQIFAYSTGYLINQKGEIVRITRSDAVSDAINGFEDTSLEEAVAKLLEK